ncbi:MAG: PorT family protein [Prevotella sp.]|nr:PorT family protein [Prevotella sp.]MBQ9651858.1 PorT family protein [Prevotella sp.]
MKKTIIFITFLWVSAIQLVAQERTVQNRPYTDLRPFHFGVLVGTHLQDLELLNVGPQIITNEDGSQVEKIITCDQDRWELGFNVGVLGEFRLHEHFALRIAPAMYFGTRHLTFHNLSDKLADGTDIEQRQELKTAYITSAFDLIFASKRFNNHRPYIMAGINPMMNLSGKDEDLVRLKRFDCYLELGIGCDFYLPFFKLRPELKFMYGLTNNLNTDHVNNMKDKNMQMYANSVKESHGKMVVLTFYFE